MNKHLYPIGTTLVKTRGLKLGSNFVLWDTGATIQLRNTETDQVWQARRIRPNDDGLVDLNDLVAEPHHFEPVNIPGPQPLPPWLFLPDLGKGSDLLIKKGVVAIPTEIKKPYRANGVSFPIEYLEQVVHILKITNDLEYIPTDRAGISLLKKIDTKGVKAPTKTQEELLAEQVKKDKKAIAKTKTAYIVLCNDRKNKELNDSKKEFAQLQIILETCSEKIIQTTRKLQLLEAKIGGIEERDDSKRHATEFDNLLTLPHVKKVEIDDRGVVVTTNTIYLEYKGDTYEMGDYTIIFNNKGFKITNLRAAELTGEPRMHHPHVNTRVGTCLGNIHHGVLLLIANHQYDIATTVIIEFLQTTAHTGTLERFWKPMKKTTKKGR
jgi:hypothetical protein